MYLTKSLLSVLRKSLYYPAVDACPKRIATAHKRLRLVRQMSFGTQLAYLNALQRPETLSSGHKSSQL